MQPGSNSCSVLVIDADPGVLIFVSRLLDQSGMRALMARTAGEALGIAARSYIPIHLILANIAHPEQSAPEIVNRIRELRPGLNALYMSTRMDYGVIRLDVQHRDSGEVVNYRQRTFVDTLRAAAGSHLAATSRSGYPYQ